MHEGKTVFAQLLELLPPRYELQKCIRRYGGASKARGFSYWDQLLCMSFAQLTYRESLRDIEICLRSQGKKLYHMGIRGAVGRSTLAHANAHRDWRIFADYARIIIATARDLYRDDPLEAELKHAVYALDATIIQLCLSLCPWAPYHKAQGGIKVHTLLDLKAKIPTFIAITKGNTHELHVLDSMSFEPGAFYVMDRGYLDYKRLFDIEQGKAFFVIRAKKDVRYRRLYSRPVDRNTGLRVDQTIRLTYEKALKTYPRKIRLVRFYDATTKRRFFFLTNNFELSAITITQLYRSRWHIELFFRWIKQHLRIKSFYGTTENAVHIQIWIAVSMYTLVAIARKQLKLDHLSLYAILQILSISIFEKKPILQVFNDSNYTAEQRSDDNQLILF